MQLRVIGPAGVLQELHRHEPLGVPERAAARAVMPGPHDRPALPGRLQHPVRPGHHRRFDPPGLRPEPLRLPLVALVPRLPRRGQQPGVHQRTDFSALNVMS